MQPTLGNAPSGSVILYEAGIGNAACQLLNVHFVHAKHGRNGHGSLVEVDNAGHSDTDTQQVLARQGKFIEESL